MSQRELARLLGISQPMVAKLKAEGMPVDSLEAAQRWRDENLAPGRRKDVREYTAGDEYVDELEAITTLGKAAGERVAKCSGGVRKAEKDLEDARNGRTHALRFLMTARPDQTARVEKAEAALAEANRELGAAKAALADVERQKGEATHAVNRATTEAINARGQHAAARIAEIQAALRADRSLQARLDDL